MIDVKVFCDRWTTRTENDEDCVGQIAKRDNYFSVTYTMESSSGPKTIDYDFCINCFACFLRSIIERKNLNYIFNIIRRTF